MDYQKARDYLDQVSVTGSVLGLDSIKALMNELNNPQDELKVVHLAGTNGKGSILTYTVSVLKEAGYKVGSYSSPSVLGYLERFQINGEWMKEEELAPLVFSVKEAADRMVLKGLVHPTVFELETAVAFLYFAKNNCDYVVLEVGMGGDMDSTNIIKSPYVCAFASISMDHIGVLGNNLEEIAITKSGIIKPGAVVVTGWQKEEAEAILDKKAKSCGCEIRKVQRDSIVKTMSDKKALFQVFSYEGMDQLKIHLLGQHQIENATTAIEILSALKEKGANLSEEAIRTGLLKSRWPGRFEVIKKEENGQDRIFIIDGAHNEDAAKRLKEGLLEYFPDVKFEAVMGVFKDKEFEKIIDILKPCLKKVYTIDLPNKDRTLSKHELAEILNAHGIQALAVNNLEEALDLVGTSTLITGSLSYLGEARSIVMK